MNRKLLWMFAAASLSMGLMACDVEEDEEGCTSDDDCAAMEICQADTMDGSGDEAAASMCVAVECMADADCATEGDTCNMTSYECETPVADPDFVYVAVVSTTDNATDLDDTNTPGPDIDAIELVSGGESFFADFVEASNTGAGGNEDGNVNGAVASILDANDAIPTDGGDCDLAEGQGFWSAGDADGFAVITFTGSRALADGDSITVWELDDAACDNVGTVRHDGYEVYVGTTDVVVDDIAASTDIGGDNWLSLGASGANGGVSDFSVVLP